MSSSHPQRWHGAVPHRPVVVGVEPGQPRWVLDEAVTLARQLGTGLVCTWADPTRIKVAEGPDGVLETTPLDPDQDDDETVAPDEEMARHLVRSLGGAPVPWLFAYTVGEAAHALASVARAHDAALIVVGARRPGLAGWMDELLGGSVAARLVHSQHRPVVVVPAPGPPA